MPEIYTLNGPHLSEVLLAANEGSPYDEGMSNNRETYISS